MPRRVSLSLFIVVIIFIIGLLIDKKPYPYTRTNKEKKMFENLTTHVCG